MKHGQIITLTQPVHVSVSETIQKTVSPWLCRWIYDGKRRNLHIPIDYQWDGASIPRVAWTTIGLTPFGILDACSLPHDEMYRSEGGRKPTQGCMLVNDNNNSVIIDRREADWLFYESMEWVKIRGPKDEIAFGIVRAFGWRHWGGPAPKR